MKESKPNSKHNSKSKSKKSHVKSQIKEEESGESDSAESFDLDRGAGKLEPSDHIWELADLSLLSAIKILSELEWAEDL